MINKIHHGDCLDLMTNIPDKSIDAIICDLPYGTTACKWDVVIPFVPLWKHYNRVIKGNGVIVLFGSEPFSSHLRLSNIKNYKYDWVWCKNTTSGGLLAKKQPLRNHENIIVFYNKQCFYNPIKEPRDLNNESKNRYKYSFNSEIDIRSNIHNNKIKRTKGGKKDLYCYPKTVKKFNTDHPNSLERVHPTQKPVKLIEYLIKTYTNETETILDNCIGSGTTAIACINTNRKYIGIEKDKGYFDIANERIKKHNEQTRMF